MAANSQPCEMPPQRGATTLRWNLQGVAIARGSYPGRQKSAGLAAVGTPPEFYGSRNCSAALTSAC